MLCQRVLQSIDFICVLTQGRDKKTQGKFREGCQRSSHDDESVWCISHGSFIDTWGRRSSKAEQIAGSLDLKSLAASDLCIYAWLKIEGPGRVSQRALVTKISLNFWAILLARFASNPCSLLSDVPRWFRRFFKSVHVNFRLCVCIFAFGFNEAPSPFQCFRFIASAAQTKGLSLPTVLSKGSMPIATGHSPKLPQPLGDGRDESGLSTSGQRPRSIYYYVRGGGVATTYLARP